MKSEESFNGISFWVAVFLIICSIMGAGILVVSIGVEDLGYFLGPVVQVLVSLMSLFTLYLLVHCASLLPKREPSYFDVCKQASVLLGYAAEFSIGLQGFGCCLSYFIILKKWIASLLDFNLKGNQANLFVSTGIMAPLALLACQKSLQKLRFASIMSTVSVSYLSLMVLFYFGVSLVYPTSTVDPAISGLPDASVKYKPMAINTKFASGIPTFLFALGCQQNMVKVFSSLRNRTVKNGTKVAAYAVAGASLIIGCVGVCGYLTVGHNQNGRTILDSLENKDGFFRQSVVKNLGERWLYGLPIARGAMILVLMAAFPIQMHPTRDSFRAFLALPLKSFVSRNKDAADLLITLSLCATIFAIAHFTDKFQLLMNIVGATASCYVMYLLPSICYMRSPVKRRPFFFLAILTSLFSVGLSAAKIYEVAKSFRAPPPAI